MTSRGARRTLLLERLAEAAWPRALQIARAEIASWRAYSLEPEWVTGPAIMKTLECWDGAGTFLATVRVMTRRAMADELRVTLGRPGSSRAAGQLRTLALEDVFHRAHYDHCLGDALPAPEPEAGPDIEARRRGFARLLGMLVPAEQRVALAVIHHGNQARAAKALSISESRVCQVMRSVRAQLF